MNTNLLVKIVIFLFFLNLNAYSKESTHLIKGIEYFNKKEFDKSKIFFERDLVFNPKSEKSYLYLAKIFKKRENIDEQENNLKNVLLINPKNDEAIYMLALIKIEQSNYNEVKRLIKELDLVCKSFCSKRKEIEEKFKELNPENAKNNN